MKVPFVVSLSLVVIAFSSIGIAVIFSFLARALMANTEAIQKLVDHLDARLDTALQSVQKSIEDVNGITQRVNMQMDRVESIVQNIESTTKDARTSVHMVNQTVVPMLANMHGIMGGIRKGIDTWNSTGGEENERPVQQ
jgi:uncharacterized protein YoxC